ncbi:MAG: universal stress protein [Cellulomonadaceae bacterium]|jgi:nucleotide-binding universal stress UspA family protein|nr:universal stress protein [Cellulomonadaceae bacterium]
MSVVVSHVNSPEGLSALTVAAQEARTRGTSMIVVSRGGEDIPGVSAVDRVVESTGDLAEDVVNTAAKENAELIVIGLRRRSPVGKLVLGAGAQRILLDSPCPVLAVKA